MKRVARFTGRATVLGSLAAFLFAAAVLGVFDDWRWFAPLVGGALLVLAAAWFWRSSPEPGAIPAGEREWRIWDEELDPDLSDIERDMLAHGCPVDAHAAQMIRALSGQTAVLPEIGLLTPPRTGRHRSDKR